MVMWITQLLDQYFNSTLQNSHFFTQCIFNMTSDEFKPIAFSVAWTLLADLVMTTCSVEIPSSVYFTTSVVV